VALDHATTATTGISMAYGNAPVEFAFGPYLKGHTASPARILRHHHNQLWTSSPAGSIVRRHMETGTRAAGSPIIRLHPAESIAFDRRPALRSGHISASASGGDLQSVEVFVHAAVTS